MAPSVALLAGSDALPAGLEALPAGTGARPAGSDALIVLRLSQLFLGPSQLLTPSHPGRLLGGPHSLLDNSQSPMFPL